MVPISVAFAEPVQEFSFQLKDVKPDGRFTVVFTSRTYDTTGGVPPVLKQNFIRIPAGAKFNKAFLKKKYYCNGSQLLDSLRLNPEGNVKFYKRMENLKSLAKRLKKFPSEKKNVKNIETCIASKVAQGTVQVDARPFINEPIPARIYLFFGKGTLPGAKASFQIIGVPDEDSPVVRNTPVVRDTRVALAANWFDRAHGGQVRLQARASGRPDPGRQHQRCRGQRHDQGPDAEEEEDNVREEEEGQVREEEGEEEQRLLVHAADMPAVRQAQLPGLLRLRPSPGQHHQDCGASLPEVRVGG